MEFVVEIMSREDIRPSSPTPSHLRSYKLSLLDQLVPVPYASMVLFYTSPTKSDTTTLREIPKRLELLKQSLSETLTQFYPLGGKIKDDLSIDCNDEGANFVVAQIKCPLSRFLVQPQVTLLYKFISNELVFLESYSGTYVTNIQVNLFECGGIAIGLSISHRIVDGAALSTFLKGWTSRARGSNQLIQPNFNASSIFPTSKSSWLKDMLMDNLASSFFKQDKCVTRRFLFKNSDIATLKAQISDRARLVPTRVEMVTAILWKSLIEVSKAHFGTQRHSLVTHSVNLRRKIDESLCPDHTMGNLLWPVFAEHMSDHEIGLEELVRMLKNSISKVDSGFVEELRSEKGNSNMKKIVRELGEKMSKDEVESCVFSSWCNFGFYEADFGWGKPTWVACVPDNEVTMNLVVFVDTRMRDGIEAWVSLDAQDMMILLKVNSELLKYATLDPSPLAMNSVV